MGVDRVDRVGSEGCLDHRLPGGFGQPMGALLGGNGDVGASGLGGVEGAGYYVLCS